MKATLEKLENCRAVLGVEVGVSRVEAALDKASRRLAGRTAIPGFRKGRAPRAVVERHLGRGALWREALDDLLAEGFLEAVRTLGIEPVGDPDFDDVHLHDGEPLTFKAAVDVRPEVRLGDYRSPRFPAEAPEVTEEQVDRFLDALREEHARLVPLEEGVAADGLFAWITYEGALGGRQVAAGQPMLIEFGRGNLPPGLEEQLLGAGRGEEREVRLEDGGLRVRIHGLARKELPALDEDFARSLGVPGLEELRAEAKNKLKEAAAREAVEQAVRRAVESAVAGAEVPSLPASAVEKRCRSLLAEWSTRLQRLGMSREDYLREAGTSFEAFQERVRAEAEREIRTEYVLEEIARAEGLEVADAEVRETLRQAGLSPAAAPAVRRSLARRKAVEFLKTLNAAEPVTPQAS